jgi:tetratricopeptide (TPR) repeat protein
MKKKLLLLVVFMAAVAQLRAQPGSVTMKKRATVDDMRELLEEMKQFFQGGGNLSFSITTADPVRSYADIPASEQYDEKYLQQQRAFLQADTSNPVAANNIANYYVFVEKNDSAFYYYNRASDHLDIKYFSNDSARYLSFRGVLKMNLGAENAIGDLDRALKLNPMDSLAIAMYPLFLIENRQFEKLVTMATQALDKPGTYAYPYIPFVFLVSGRLLSDYFPKAEQANDEKLRAKYAAMDYDKLFNMSLIDKYATKYATNTEIRNARDMTDVYALALKMLFFTDMDKPDPVFAYTARDKERLRALEKKFSSPAMEKDINPYSRNKVLGFIFFMLQQKEKSIAHFNEAIRVFPVDKRSRFFDPGEAYDAIIAIHDLGKADSSYRQAILAKIKAEPLGKKNSTDYNMLAQHYFIKNEMKNAREWAMKAKEINPYNAAAWRLLTHLSYLDQDENLQSHIEQAAIVIENADPDNQYSFLMQVAIYYLLNGSASQAYNNINMAKQVLGSQPCKLCDKLLGKYITVNSK